MIEVLLSERIRKTAEKLAPDLREKATEAIGKVAAAFVSAFLSSIWERAGLLHESVVNRKWMNDLANPGSPMDLSLETAIRMIENEWTRYRVKRAWLFGSRATQGAHGASDWDFLVEFSQPPTFDTFMGLKGSLEAHLNGRVDLLSRSACTSRFLKAIEGDLVNVA